MSKNLTAAVKSIIVVLVAGVALLIAGGVASAQGNTASATALAGTVHTSVVKPMDPGGWAP